MHFFKMNEDPYHAKNPLVEQNVFLKMKADPKPLPCYEDVKDKLPKPVWNGRKDVIDCYDFAWKTAFGNLRNANEDARIVSDFIDTAFNGQLFMWDSSFIVMFGKYVNHIFNFQKTLDNFYSHQHVDGFISRQLCETEEGARFSRDDPASTGPNIMPWAEWEYFCTTKDLERLNAVFTPLLAYHKWLQLNRTWQNGGYWSCGLACGMDNQPRMDSEYNEMVSHGFMTWIDTCAQQYLSADILIKMAEVLNKQDQVDWLKEEKKMLYDLINQKMWNDKTAYYYDAKRDGSLSGVKTIGAYWALLAGLVPKERQKDFISHLTNEKEFNRKCPLPTLSADHPQFDSLGGYWKGGVWSPTNYMALKGLEKYGYNDLAHQIARKYLECVVGVYSTDKTLYENYAPDQQSKGNFARKDFVGWTGLAPISVLFEYVFGIRPDAQNDKITWHVNLTEEHGILQYPLKDTLVDLVCEKRNSLDEKPKITLKCDKKITLEVIYNGKKEIITN